MKRILGLDLGTNSIGWALVEIDKENFVVNVIALGSRIIPMDSGEISKFQEGATLTSKAANRTDLRSARKNKERYILRRDRLHVILNILKALPEHYTVNIDFGKKRGQFKNNTEPNLAYYEGDKGKKRFYFLNSYEEMLSDFRIKQPELFYGKPIKNNLGKSIGTKETKIPYDWTLYYLRQKALNEKISLEELSWILLSYNQKRGYKAVRGSDEKENDKEVVTKQVLSAIKTEDNTFKIELGDKPEENQEAVVFFTYFERTNMPVTKVGDFKEVEMSHKIDENGKTIETEYLIQEIQERKVVDVKKGSKNKSILVFDSGLEKEDSRKDAKKLIGQNLEIIIKTTYLKDGIQKSGARAQSISIPDDSDWKLKKLKIDADLNAFIIENSDNNKNVGVSTYLYEKLLDNPDFKIKGGTITVISRDHYKNELTAILDKQKEFYPDTLDDIALFKKAVQALYPKNEIHRKELLKKDLTNFIANDTILFQRELKSKKSEIKNCTYEARFFNKKNNDTYKDLIQKKLKVVPKSNPYFQEFRLWQLIRNLKVYAFQKSDGKDIKLNVDVTQKVVAKLAKIKDLNELDEEKLYQQGINMLFSFLFNRREITEKQFLKFLNLNEKEYYWNRSSRDRDNDKIASREGFPCNETRAKFITKLRRVKIDDESFNWEAFLTFENTFALWHFAYSIKLEDTAFRKALSTLFTKLLNQNDFSLRWLDPLINEFESIRPYPSDFANYSEKAIKKILPLIQTEQYQTNQTYIHSFSEKLKTIKDKWEAIEWDKEKISQIVDKEDYSKGTLTAFHKKRYDFNKKPSFLNTDQACYLIYNKYSEVGETHQWHSVEAIKDFIKNDFRQHSLNNPVVEGVLIETMNLVCKIWETYGNENEKFFDNIHLELSRDLKKSKKGREAISDRNSKNKATNKRIKQLLTALKEDIKEQDISEEKFKQKERLKLIEEGALDIIKYDKGSESYHFKDSKKDDEGKSSITKKELSSISNKAELTRSELVKYKLWLEQRYQSPYTGKFIKLSDLFNREKYEIEHILPKKRVNLDAMYNKIICETEVNKVKDQLTGYEFIKTYNGGTIFCSAHSKDTEVLKPLDYKKLAENNFSGTKRDILLSENIPSKFTNAQFVNTAYIGKIAMKWLSNVVRAEEDDDYFKSKNLLSVNGMVTSMLRQDWHLNDAWGDLVNDRFKRLNAITDSKLFGEERIINGHKIFVGNVPEEIDEDFSKKRIDHRHHALDALVVALTTQAHINYINNIHAKSAKSEIHQKLKNKLTFKGNNGRNYKLPFEWWKEEPKLLYQGEITEDFPKIKNLTKKALEDIIISFKKNNKVATQATNKIERWETINGKKRKVLVSQNDLRKENGNEKNWGVRRKIHKDTLYGRSKLYQFKTVVSIEEAFENIDLIVNPKLREQIKGFKEKGRSKKDIVNLLEINGIKKIAVYIKYIRSRFKGKLDSSFDESKIEMVTDPSIREILSAHLKNPKYQNQVDEKNKKIKPEELAFSTQGVKEMNDNIKILNKGQNHKPIYKVGIYEKEGEKFQVGEAPHKTKRFVETADGANVYCGIYEKEGLFSQRQFFTPKIKDSIEAIKNNERYSLEEKKIIENEVYNLKFILQPNDLVYLPFEEEIEQIKDGVGNIKSMILNRLKSDPLSKIRIYKFNNASGSTLRFVPQIISNPILQLTGASLKSLKEINSEKEFKNLEIKNELGGKGSISNLTRELINDRLNNSQDLQIKDYCIKLNVDKLGRIQSLEL
ncbi:type II CRISPR RNA-guided endonuclease Cas9 [Zunongwangia sp. H14]|uniref:type II CRISPR RNA-guided endonuclease Cas9 n=1 Tax=Zunongwangia sp. H14 TaxID=3240792 RepID=UPI0035696DDB